MRTALISGGTKGIGRASVLQLLNDGLNVATFSRDEQRCKDLMRELSETYEENQYLVLHGDVTKEDDVERVVLETEKKFSTIDVLLNNAGIGYFIDVDRMDLQRFRQMIDTNIVGVALLTKHVVPIMKAQKSGLIMNLASISGKMAFPYGEFYSSAKFAVMGYSEGIRKELQPFGIKVATIAPGMIQTEFFDPEELERRKKIWNGKIPQMLNVADITRIVSLICNQSDHADIQDLTIMPFDRL